MNDKINGYALSRQWFEFALNNPEKISTAHAALYFWIIQLNNELGWKQKFGLPTYHSMDAIGVKSYKTFKKAFEDLISWGFILLVQKAKNNHTSNIIELVKFTKSVPGQEDLSLQNLPSQYQVTATIDKPIQTDKTIKTKEPEKIPSPDLISLIIDEFKIIFPGYVITTPGKERASAGKLLKIFKGLYPELSSEDMLTKLREHFTACKNINNTWYRDNMSLSIMVNKYNEVNTVLNKPQQQNPGSSPDLAEVDTTNFLNGQ